MSPDPDPAWWSTSIGVLLIVAVLALAALVGMTFGAGCM